MIFWETFGWQKWCWDPWRLGSFVLGDVPWNDGQWRDSSHSHLLVKNGSSFVRVPLLDVYLKNTLVKTVVCSFVVHWQSKQGDLVPFIRLDIRIRSGNFTPAFSHVIKLAKNVATAGRSLTPRSAHQPVNSEPLQTFRGRDRAWLPIFFGVG